MDKIVVCDNFLTEKEFETVSNIIKTKSWQWGHESMHKDRIETPFWSCDLIDTEYLSKNILHVIEKHFGKRYKIIRLYANAQTYGQDGAFHTDSDEPNSYTFCYYITKINDDFIDTAGGHLHFKLPDVKYKICYEPIFNRGIMFPSNYIHRACSFTRYFMDLRVCIAWKLVEIMD